MRIRMFICSFFFFKFSNFLKQLLTVALMHIILHSDLIFKVVILKIS